MQTFYKGGCSLCTKRRSFCSTANNMAQSLSLSSRLNSISSHGEQKPRAGEATGWRSHGREEPQVGEATDERSHG